LLVALLLCPPRPSGAAAAGAPADSAGGSSIERWLPHGSYQTGYTVNRSVQTWTQTFSTPYTYGKLQIRSNVNFSYSTDSNNQRKTIGRTSRTSVNYTPVGGLKLGLAFDLTRNRMTTPAISLKTKTDRDKVLLTGEYSFSPLSGMNTTISGKAGSVDEFLENRTIERTGRGRDTSFELQNTYKPTDALTWSLKLGRDMTALDSKDSRTGLKTKDENIQESYTTALSYRPGPGWSINLSAGRLRTRFQYPRQDVQETKDGLANNFSLQVNLQPIRNLNLGFSAKADQSDIDFKVERIRSTSSKSKSFAGNLSYSLYGFKFDTSLNWEDKRDEYGSGPDVPVSVTSQAGYTYTRSLTATLSRSLGNKVTARGALLITLRRYEFDDKENNPDDRDFLNRSLSLDITYRPSPRYKAGLGLARRTDELVYVDPRRSANTREGQTYTVSADFTFNMSSTTSITQSVRMNADYSFYKYSSTRNLLIRSTTLHTVFTTKPTRRISLALVHDYRHQDQGGVVREDGAVFYGKTGINERHDMTLKLGYEPVRGFKIFASQRFQPDRRYSIEDGRRLPQGGTDRVELMGGVQAKYKFSEGAVLDAKAERVDSTIEGKYWRVNATFSRTF